MKYLILLLLVLSFSLFGVEAPDPLTESIGELIVNLSTVPYIGKYVVYIVGSLGIISVVLTFVVLVLNAMLALPFKYFDKYRNGNIPSILKWVKDKLIPRLKYFSMLNVSDKEKRKANLK